ncbi:MAG: SsrA-binding protein SmpB [Candidatus Microgenomates bacterium]
MKIINKKFNRDYEEIESFEAGIILTGAEVKSIKNGGLKLEDSYVKIFQDGPYLINANIPKYKFDPSQNYKPTRSRKLLLNKKEIIRLITKMKSAGLTIAPKSCYNKGDLIKLEIALVKGRKDIEKRKLEKQKDIKVATEKELKEYLRG